MMEPRTAIWFALWKPEPTTSRFTQPDGRLGSRYGNYGPPAWSRHRHEEWLSSRSMDSQTARAKLDQWYKALNARDFKELAALITEIGDVAIEVEYPQSGERIKGRENNLAILENYPGLPDATIKKMHGTEDKWRSEERRVGKECRSRWSPDH